MIQTEEPAKVNNPNNNNITGTDQSPCLQCKGKIIPSDELVKSLLHVQSTFSIVSKKQRKFFSLFTCRVCDHTVLNRENITKHVGLHFNSKEILYCKNCQDQMNKLTLGFFDEIQELVVPYEKLLKQRKGLVQYSLTHATSTVPNCGFCSRSFGYLVPILNRVSHRLEKRGYECNICGENKSHIKGMLTHAQNHVEDKVLFCRDCINNYRLQQEFYFPTTGEEVDISSVEQPTDNTDEKLRPTESEYKIFTDQLLQATKKVPPFPIPLSSSESSEEAMPEPYGRKQLDKKRARKAKIESSRYKGSKKTNVLSFSFGREIACFACFTGGTTKRDHKETSAYSIFTCQMCKKELGGWEYARGSMFRRESVMMEEHKAIGQFACQICSFISEEWAPMENHILSHLEKNDVHCIECLKKTKPGKK